MPIIQRYGPKKKCLTKECVENVAMLRLLRYPYLKMCNVCNVCNASRCSLLRVTALFVNALRESNDSHQIKRALRRILELSKMAATYSPTNAVPSAMLSLTTLFGMGRGGTSTL